MVDIWNYDTSIKIEAEFIWYRTLNDDVKHVQLSKLLSAFLIARIDHITKASRSNTGASNI